MNICFLTGKIISNIDFEFILDDKKNTSIAIFKLKVDENCILKVKGYNAIADMCYRNLLLNNYISLQGYLTSDMEIIAYGIELI